MCRSAFSPRRRPPTGTQILSARDDGSPNADAPRTRTRAPTTDPARSRRGKASRDDVRGWRARAPGCVCGATPGSTTPASNEATKFRGRRSSIARKKSNARLATLGACGGHAPCLRGVHFTSLFVHSKFLHKREVIYPKFEPRAKFRATRSASFLTDSVPWSSGMIPALGAGGPGFDPRWRPDQLSYERVCRFRQSKPSPPLFFLFGRSRRCHSGQRATVDMDVTDASAEFKRTKSSTGSGAFMQTAPMVAEMARERRPIRQGAACAYAESLTEEQRTDFAGCYVWRCERGAARTNVPSPTRDTTKPRGVPPDSVRSVGRPRRPSLTPRPPAPLKPNQHPHPPLARDPLLSPAETPPGAARRASR